MNRLQLALDQIVFARDYTRRLLDTFADDEWFRMPHEGVTHLAWQVGHLAMAQYRLALERLRGPMPDDGRLISEQFLQVFGRDSVPDPDSNKYPPIADIRACFDRVHARVLEELPAVADAVLDEPPLKPHPLAQTKLACLWWCGHHEMSHAGQIGLLRRLLGKPPMW